MNLKRIVFGIMLMLLAAYSSTAIFKANSATAVSIVISPDTTTPPSRTFMLDLTINNVADMYAWSVTLVYQKIITLNWVNTINDTAFTDGTGLAIFRQEDYNSTCYRSYVARTLLNVVPGTPHAGISGSGLVAQLNFLAASEGTTAINVIEKEIMNSKTENIASSVTVTTPTITVATPQPTPPPAAVGGTSFSVAKAVFPAPYIGLASAILAVVAIIATTIYFKGIKRRKEKQ